MRLAVAFSLSVALLVSSPARAHFILQEPASWAEQGSLGDPQKSAPCGAADPGVTAVATGTVTAFGQGQLVRVTINETVAHPGHYRVALSVGGQSGLPADPPVTPVGTDECGSKEIQNPPVYPVIADGMLPHTTAFSGPQSFTVQLPASVTCNANCVLQVTEFMQNHGAPCFYHHCANIAILPPDGTGGSVGTGGRGGITGTGGGSGTSGAADAGPGDGGSVGTGGRGGSTGTGGGSGTSGAADAGSGEGASDSGCGCAAGGGRGSALGLLAMLLVVGARRRRGR
jgi:MYXO-CTERM domain-containing protein